MSRFNNPQTQPVRAPLGQGQASPLEQDPQAWAAQTTAGRPAARPAQTQAPQQAFGNRPASPVYSQPQPGGYPQQPSPYAQQGFGQPGAYGADLGSQDPFAALRADPPTQPPRQDYQYPQQADAFSNGQYALPQQPAALSTYQPRPAAQQYDPYAQPAQTYAAQPAPQPGFGAASSYPTPQPDTAFAGFDTWSATHPQTDTRDYPAAFDNGYQQQSPRTQPPAGTSAWVGQDHYAQLGMEPSFEGAAAYGQPVQPQAPGAFDQTYADDELEYEAEPPRRGWTRMAAILASTVLLGGGLTYAYTALMGGSPNGAPPVVKSAEGPSKVKPSDPGGKQFAHTDSKVMGRLEGGASDTETGSTSSSSNVDSSGARKVPVLVVGRDGTIQPPAAPSDDPGPAPARATVSSVPGLTVIDGFGGPPRPQPQRITTTASEPPSRPLVVSPPAAPVKPKVIAAATPATLTDSGPSDSEPAAAPPAKKAPVKKVAAVSPPAAVGGPAPSGAGYVAVLASVPASGSSRIDALKQFADMQQKYGSILQNKTPDVQEANLGEKGTYHRLLVGPPGSRDSASQLCSDLKGQGYSNCWVTAY